MPNRFRKPGERRKRGMVGPMPATKTEQRASAKRVAGKKTAGNVAGTMSESQRKSSYGAALKQQYKERGLSGSGE